MSHIVWKNVTSEEHLDHLWVASADQKQIIFKHSTRCPVSSVIKNRISKQGDELPADLEVYFLDLLRFRNLSDRISEEYKIRHESPQLLVIQNEECIHHASHFDISLERISGLTDPQHSGTPPI